MLLFSRVFELLVAVVHLLWLYGWVYSRYISGSCLRASECFFSFLASSILSVFLCGFRHNQDVQPVGRRGIPKVLCLRSRMGLVVPMLLLIDTSAYNLGPPTYDSAQILLFWQISVFSHLFPAISRFNQRGMLVPKHWTQVVSFPGLCQFLPCWQQHTFQVGFSGCASFGSWMSW